jgi:hypothetical protein
MTDHHLPPNIPRRCLSPDEAAEYCNVSRNTLIRHGPLATKIGDRTVYDRRVLDTWLDKLAGIAPDQPADDPETSLLEAIHARKTALRHAPS